MYFEELTPWDKIKRDPEKIVIKMDYEEIKNVISSMPFDTLIKEYNELSLKNEDESTNIIGKFIFDKIVDTNYKMDYDAIKAVVSYLFRNSNVNSQSYRIDFEERKHLFKVFIEYGSYYYVKSSYRLKHIININVKNILKTKGNVLYETIDTFYHELYHSIHLSNQVYGRFVNLEYLQTALDSVINQKFYYKNYSVLIEELKAREFGAEQTIKLLREYDSFDQNYLDRKEKEVQHWNSLIKINRAFPNNKDMLEFSFKKAKNIVKKSPEILKTYPILNVLYDKYGHAKDANDIFHNIKLVRYSDSKIEMYCELIYLMLKKDPTLIYRLNEHMDTYKYALEYMEDKLQHQKTMINNLHDESKFIEALEYLRMESNINRELLKVRILNKMAK